MSNTHRKTKIIATIGPSSQNDTVLEFFANNNVEIARLNCSHSATDWHIEAGNMARSKGLKLLMDLPGPKIRLGNITTVKTFESGKILVLEQENPTNKDTYPYLDKEGRPVLPYEFPLHKFVKAGDPIFVDDGKIEWHVIEVIADRVVVEVYQGGPVKSRKSMNMPETKLTVDFLRDRDILFINELLPVLRPDYVAASFVKTVDDIARLKKTITDVLAVNKITDYYPQICAKLEMSESVDDVNLPEIVAECDILMVARGDLALETLPAHIRVPFLQEKIKQECLKQGKPFIVATQMLESMTESSVPTRAEVSDIYRAVHLDDADYIMCSGETAAGLHPRKSVKVMSDLITYHE
jgi:pyruvate kinase